MDKLLQQMKEEWERMTPEQKKKWKAVCIRNGREEMSYVIK